MRQRVHEEMSARLDTGIRVNPMLAKAFGSAGDAPPASDDEARASARADAKAAPSGIDLLEASLESDSDHDAGEGQPAHDDDLGRETTTTFQVDVDDEDEDDDHLEREGALELLDF